VFSSPVGNARNQIFSPWREIYLLESTWEIAERASARAVGRVSGYYFGRGTYKKREPTW